MVWYGILGALFGIIGGMGMGGGIILIPVLTLFFGFPQQEAQALNLLCFLPMAGFALFFHIKNKQVEFKTALILALCGLIGAAAGAYLAGLLENELLKKLFGGFLILLGLYKGYRLIKRKE